MLIQEIKQLANEIHAYVIEIRRHLHAHPELSFCEYETSAYVKQDWMKWAFPGRPWLDTGVVAID